MLNRAALVSRYKQPFVDWINAADPVPSSRVLSLSEVNEDSNVYLVEVEDGAGLDHWLELNAGTVFENELNGWYQDESPWPADRSLGVLREWCTLQLHTIVIDAGATPLADDGLD